MGVDLQGEVLKKVIFKHRIQPLSVLDGSSKVLKAGEPVVGYETVNGVLIMKLKYGDGQTPVKSLPYISTGTYQLSTTVTEDTGQFERGDSLFGLGIDEIIDKLVTPYNNVEIQSLQLSIASKEVGVPFSDNLVITPSILHSYNLAAGNAGIVESSPSLFDPEGVDPRSTIQITGDGTTKTTITDIDISLTIYGKEGESSTKSATLSFLAPVLYKSFTGKTSLIVGDLSSMTKVLKKSSSGIYSFDAGRGFMAVCNKVTLPNTFVYLDYYNEYSFGGMDMTYQGELVESNGYIDLTYKVYKTTYEHNKRFKIAI